MTRNITTLLMLLLSRGCYGERKAWSAERGGWREKSGGMQESGHALAGQKRHFCCWQRAGTILAAPAANIGGGREKEWQRALTSCFYSLGASWSKA